MANDVRYTIEMTQSFWRRIIIWLVWGKLYVYVIVSDVWQMMYRYHEFVRCERYEVMDMYDNIPD